MTSVNGHRADATTLTGISETALLTLRARANEARRPDAIIDDPLAIRLMWNIDGVVDVVDRLGETRPAPSAG